MGAKTLYKNYYLPARPGIKTMTAGILMTNVSVLSLKYLAVSPKILANH
jgi:hypothetical protein